MLLKLNIYAIGTLFCAVRTKWCSSKQHSFSLHFQDALDYSCKWFWELKNFDCHIKSFLSYYYHLNKQKYASSIRSTVSMAAINAMGKNIPAIVPTQNANVSTPNIFAVRIKGFLLRKHFRFPICNTSAPLWYILCRYLIFATKKPAK